MIKTLRSVISLRKFDWNSRRRRLARGGNIDDLRLFFDGDIRFLSQFQ